MNEITIDLVYENIKEVVDTKGRNLVIHFNNGDRLTLYRSEKTKRLRRHLLKTFNGEHL
jgi:hypothetical protein